MYFGLLINLGEWAFPMLLAEPPRHGRVIDYEIESFFPTRCFRTKTIVARSEEEVNFVRTLQGFPIFANPFFEVSLVLEVMVYI